MGAPVDRGDRTMGNWDSKGSAGRRDDPALSIVIPAFNEADRLAGALGRLLEVLWEGAFDPASTEIVVVDDGSEDATADVAMYLLAGLPRSTVLRLPTNRGKGAAVRAGVAHATGSVVTFLDADMAVDPSALPNLVRQLDGLDVAIGSRSVEGSLVDCRSVRRTLMGRAFNHLATTATGLALKDTQCGFKAFRSPVARLLFHFAVIDRFAFDVEILHLARSLGLRIGEVPVSWRHVPGSHIRPLADPMSMVTDLWRTRSRHSSITVQGLLATPPAHVGRHAPTPAANDDPGSCDAAAHTLRSVVRQTDAVLPWGHGALVLLPLYDAEEQVAVRASVAHRLPGWELEPARVRFDQLIAAAPLSARIVTGTSEAGYAPPPPLPLAGTPSSRPGSSTGHVTGGREPVQQRAAEQRAAGAAGHLEGAGRAPRGAGRAPRGSRTLGAALPATAGRLPAHPSGAS